MFGIFRLCLFRLSAPALALVLCLALMLCAHPSRAADRLSPESVRFYRAVYVLQSFGGPAAEEKVDIPAKIRRSDEAESLRFHPDRRLVLRRLADDLAALTPHLPVARLFEAYARLSLGDPKAVHLLSDYISDAPYSARHYALLCDLLLRAGNAPELQLICREWLERDPSCRPDRALHTWNALISLQQFAEARALAVREAGCIGLPAPLYAAYAVEAQGDPRAAENIVRDLLAQHPGQEAYINDQWRRLRANPPKPYVHRSR